ncbi:MAG: hypothetical protein ACO1N0_02785 [Fluviicola sp.]
MSTTVHYIQYLDKFGTLQRIKFSEVFDMWVDSLGGKRSFIDKLSKSPPSEILTIPVIFLLYFGEKFQATIPEDVDQEFIYDLDFYQMYINRVASDVDNAPLGRNSVQSIVTLIIVGLAILGLVSLCK